ncbi:MAG: FAD-dependent oxidoreductase [Rhodomicrobium sp.]
MTGISYEQALAAWRMSSPAVARDNPLPREDLLARYHPDYRAETRTTIKVGPNAGDPCHRLVADWLHTNARINEAALAGATVTDTDVLVIGGGGAGCAAALTATKAGAKVLVATKLRLGDSNTVMAEAGIQAAVRPEDSPQRHFEDTLRGGHFKGDKQLVAQMVMDGPDVIRWLIRLGMQFDHDGGDLRARRPGGATADRILCHRDCTGLEMMRVLREAVLNSSVTVWNRSPVVELLCDEHGHCAGAVVFSLDICRYCLVRAKAVILATGGSGRLHLNGFPTSNHFGATGDGLVLAYRLGARVRDLDSFQYHPTGLADPPRLAGSLVSEATRSAGATLVNGLGERFVDELKPRDQVAAAIIRECEEGRGVVSGAGHRGVFLDTPALELREPGIIAKQFVSVIKLAKKCGHDPARLPFLVYPTLHFQNGGVVIDANGASSVPNLFCVGEVAGGVHGHNRLAGNALLEILSFGRRAGVKAAERSAAANPRKILIEHVTQRQRELTKAGLPLDRVGPPLFPDYANFDKTHMYTPRARPAEVPAGESAVT